MYTHEQKGAALAATKSEPTGLILPNYLQVEPEGDPVELLKGDITKLAQVCQQLVTVANNHKDVIEQQNQVLWAHGQKIMELASENVELARKYNTLRRRQKRQGYPMEIDGPEVLAEARQEEGQEEGQEEDAAPVVDEVQEGQEEVNAKEAA